MGRSFGKGKKPISGSTRVYSPDQVERYQSQFLRQQTIKDLISKIIKKSDTQYMVPRGTPDSLVETYWYITRNPNPSSNPNPSPILSIDEWENAGGNATTYGVNPGELNYLVNGDFFKVQSEPFTVSSGTELQLQHAYNHSSGNIEISIIPYNAKTGQPNPGMTGGESKKPLALFRATENSLSAKVKLEAGTWRVLVVSVGGNISGTLETNFAGQDGSALDRLPLSADYTCDCPYFSNQLVKRDDIRDWSKDQQNQAKPKRRCWHIWIVAYLAGDVDVNNVPKDLPALQKQIKKPFLGVDGF